MTIRELERIALWPDVRHVPELVLEVKRLHEALEKIEALPEDDKRWPIGDRDDWIECSVEMQSMARAARLGKEASDENR